jgi:hypothetical protein
MEVRMTARAIALATFALVAGAPAHAAAQTVVIDEGTFRLSVRGSAVGNETFTIRRTGSGATTSIVAQGRILLDTGDQTRALLQVDGPGLRPAAYQIEAAGPERQTVRGQAAGNRFRAQIVSPAGETMREYLISEGAIILDDGVAHHHYFIANRPPGTGIPIIVPRQNRQVTGTIRDDGRETLTIGGQQIQARRVIFEPAGLPTRTLWVDDQGRMLRLSIPDQGYVAERTAAP